MTKTMGSDEARLRWRDTLDAALQGEVTIIERYSKPIAAVINYAEWQRLQRAHSAELQRRLQEEETIPWEDVKAEMATRGLIDVDG